MSYGPAEKYIVPYVSQIWSSFKYEVRHGEIPEAIQETLAIFSSLSKRLASELLEPSLKSFVDKAWDDCAEDLENPTYTEQAGSILISIAQAHLTSFRLICPRMLDAVRRTIAQPKSTTHTKALVTVLNNLLRARRSALPLLPVKHPKDTYVDDSITITRGIYFSLWKENSVDNPTKEQTDIAKQVLEGLSQVVKQRRLANDGQSYVSDCDEAVFQEVCGTLAHRVANCFNIQVSTSEGGKEVEDAAIEALRTTVTFYPTGYGKIISDFIGEVEKRNWTNNPTERSYEALSACSSRLASIGCLSLPEDSAPLANFAAFSGGMLKVLGLLFNQKADLKACALVAHSLAQGLRNFTQTLLVRGPIVQENVSWSLEGANDFVKGLQPTFPDLVQGHDFQFDPTHAVHLLFTEVELPISFLQFGIYIVVQLYRHATRVVETNQGVSLDLCQLLAAESDHSDERKAQVLGCRASWRDRYLGQVANIATTIFSMLETPAQADLCLQDQILGCFHASGPSGTIQSWNQHKEDTISELSVGIARAIRSELVLRLVSWAHHELLHASL